MLRDVNAPIVVKSRRGSLITASGVLGSRVWTGSAFASFTFSGFGLLLPILGQGTHLERDLGGAVVRIICWSIDALPFLESEPGE